MDVDKAIETQIKNIQTRTGKSLDELFGLIRQSGLQKHGEIRDMLKSSLGMGYGDANTLVHSYLKSASGAEPSATALSGDVLDEIYSGAKAGLPPRSIRSSSPGSGRPTREPGSGWHLAMRRRWTYALRQPTRR
jgi:hypothetical protein